MIVLYTGQCSTVLSLQFAVQHSLQYTFASPTHRYTHSSLLFINTCPPAGVALPSLPCRERLKNSSVLKREPSSNSVGVKGEPSYNSVGMRREQSAISVGVKREQSAISVGMKREQSTNSVGVKWECAPPSRVDSMTGSCDEHEPPAPRPVPSQDPVFGSGGLTQRSLARNVTIVAEGGGGPRPSFGAGAGGGGASFGGGGGILRNKSIKPPAALRSSTSFKRAPSISGGRAPGG